MIGSATGMGFRLLAATFVALPLSAQVEVHVDPYCVAPLGWNGEQVTSSNQPPGITISCGVGPNEIGVAYFGLAMPCTAMAPFGEVGVGSSLGITPLPAGISFSQFVPLSLPPALHYIPFVVQFARWSQPAEFGTAYAVVVSPPAIPRDSTEPVTLNHPTYGHEMPLYGDSPFHGTAVWAPMVDGMPRALRLVPQVTPSPQGQQFTAANPTAPYWIKPGVDFRVAPPLLVKLEQLAQLVNLRWGYRNYQLRITDAKRPPSGGNGSTHSYHRYGRGLDCSLGFWPANGVGNKVTTGTAGQAAHLDELARLAVQVGFDFVWHEPGSNTCGVPCDHVHATIHTGGPQISSVDVTPGALVPGVSASWTVTATVTDLEQDGVWQLYADVVRPGDPLAPLWLSSALRVDFETSEVNGVVQPMPLLPNTATVTFDVTAPLSVLQGGTAELHLWARDTFGSVSIDTSTPPPRLPETTAVPVTALLFDATETVTQVIEGAPISGTWNGTGYTVFCSGEGTLGETWAYSMAVSLDAANGTAELTLTFGGATETFTGTFNPLTRSVSFTETTTSTPALNYLSQHTMQIDFTLDATWSSVSGNVQYDASTTFTPTGDRVDCTTTTVLVGTLTP